MDTSGIGMAGTAGPGCAGESGAGEVMTAPQCGHGAVVTGRFQGTSTWPEQWPQ